MPDNSDILYPPITPFLTDFLKTEDGHEIYYEVSGNENGVPVVYLHGGPGAGTSPQCRQFFDPKHYKIILFDQRGCGKSKPLGALKNNTTSHLIKDMEAIRETLKIDKWHLFGGSWGSTLSIAYAIAHPEKCISLILRGIFLMRQSEIDWFLDHMKQFFPDAFEKLKSIVPDESQDDILNFYYQKLLNGTDEEKILFGTYWVEYESKCAHLIPEPVHFNTDKKRLNAWAMALLETHYFLNNKFETDNYLLENIDKIKHIPATAIQGRYDIICPNISAYELSKAWRELDLIMVNTGGHSSNDRSICEGLLKATEKSKHIN